ncbi:MAG: SAM-dependent chlorinase/fluorinase [Solirubrobacteraceae bacterium]|nr:SAM-dependent chlorinase/fluorinase [Solirubrobacteraceae bacterium]
MGRPTDRFGGPGARSPLIAALTDYGIGPYAALLQASARYPAAVGIDWLDLDHGVALGDVRAGALTLRRTLPHLPPCVCVGVVDPGVGTARRAVALRTATGHVLVGPDNGLLQPAARRLGGVTELVDLGGSPLRIHGPARTFDGRDLFGPVAGALAAGTPLSDVGVEVEPASLMVLALPAPRRTVEGIDATVLEVDHFGTLVLALDEQLTGLGPLPPLGASGRVRSALGGGEAFVLGQTFADAPHGGLVLFVDSDGALALARRDGSAAALLHSGPADALTLAFGGDDADDDGPLVA